jgi:hypothetical protein
MLPAAKAQYPSAKPNSALREEVTGDPDRLISVTEHFALAIDGNAYFRALGRDDYYHGEGYWVQARTEARVSDHFRINMRSIFFAGASSFGYARPSGYYQLLGLTGEFPEKVLGGTLWVRALDLDRQTAGAGLVIQDKEFNGAILRWTFENHAFVLRADGTGLFRAADDTYNPEVKLFSGLIGAGSIIWPSGINEDQLTKMRDPHLYLFSRQSYDWFSYALEYGTRGSGDAEMIMLGAKNSVGGLSGELRTEARHYSKTFGSTFAGRVHSQYVSYDQYDKVYTNLSNIWVRDDSVNVFAAHLNLWWKLSHSLRFHSLNESGQFNYQETGTLAYYYFRQGVEYCPGNDSREDCISLFFSNKVLANSNAVPPQTIVLQNDPLFKTVPFVGIEGRFRL